MGTSGNPKKRAAQKAEERKISPIGDFKKRLGGIVELPSGVSVKVRNPGGMRVFMDSGIIPNSLMGIIQESLDKGRQMDSSQIVKDGKIDPEMMLDMTTMMDNITMKVVVEPKVHPVPEDEDDRDDELLYVDEFPDDDKMFLFQWVSGGTRDLEQFRQQHAQNMGTLAAVTSNEPPTE